MHHHHSNNRPIQNQRQATRRRCRGDTRRNNNRAIHPSSRAPIPHKRAVTQPIHRVKLVPRPPVTHPSRVIPRSSSNRRIIQPMVPHLPMACSDVITFNLHSHFVASLFFKIISTKISVYCYYTLL